MSAPEDFEGTFLIADLSGYTALTEAHGDASAAKIVTRYVELVQGALHPGARLVERVADEVLIVAVDAISVLRTAIRLRESIEQEPFFPTTHAGIHGGTVLEQDGHYVGSALNLTSRLAGHARGNQILCTEKVVAMAGDVDDIDFRALEPVQFKNIPNAVAVFEIVCNRHVVDTKLIDPVCRMQVTPDTAPARLPFGDETYYFCSFECVKIFTAHPDHYVET